jgi:hypothetical protein
MTLLVNLNQDHGHHVIFDLREESNTQWDFGIFVLRCIEQRHLQEGTLTDV